MLSYALLHMQLRSASDLMRDLCKFDSQKNMPELQAPKVNRSLAGSALTVVDWSKHVLPSLHFSGSDLHVGRALLQMHVWAGMSACTHSTIYTDGHKSAHTDNYARARACGHRLGTTAPRQHGNTAPRHSSAPRQGTKARPSTTARHHSHRGRFQECDYR